MHYKNEIQSSIEELFQLYSNDVFRYARLSLGNHEQAKDVVQEVFIKAYRAWDSFRHESNPKTWLISIARNYIYDLRRKNRREAKSMEAYEAPSGMDASVSIETMMILEESLLYLKKNYRDVFVLRHIEDLSIEETAKILGWTEGKVRTTDYRAIAKLRDIMGQGNQEVTFQR